MQTLVVIKMSSFTDYNRLVDEASKVNGDVTLIKGRYAIDAKSRLGVFSLDLSQGATIEYPSDATAFTEFLTPFMSKVEG